MSTPALPARNCHIRKRTTMRGTYTGTATSFLMTEEKKKRRNEEKKKNKK